MKVSCKYSPNHTQNKLNLEYFDSYNLIIDKTAVIIWTQFLKKDHKNNIFVRLLNLSNITSIGLAPEDSCEDSMELASNQDPMILRNKHASRISDQTDTLKKFCLIFTKNIYKKIFKKLILESIQ
ncbi:hypothetical protein CWI37_0105p0040 [Hamiltosporidium tvaerminnensis]|uniref:Uncharacterized protein n=1 Tax=Hamiltosporidium tvaerminnensis TaxID=1176355 RepID=A0A4Q9LA89_9MICR|nr:hypothetical protein CWI37_0105p0040 [Hamiltosporidium tvaerminnensis]